jgi:hypothetical protein
MKNLHLKFILAAAILWTAGATPAQQKTAEKPAPQAAYTVALRTASGNYVSMVAGGGIDAAAKSVTPKQIFTFIDLNGGTLVDGDKVKIRYEQSFWREDKDKKIIHRVPSKGSKEEECTFILRVKGNSILLETPSGKFVAVSSDGKTIETREKREEASLLEAVPAQLPATTPAK